MKLFGRDLFPKRQIRSKAKPEFRLKLNHTVVPESFEKKFKWDKHLYGNIQHIKD